MADSNRQDVLLRITAQDLSSADVNKVASAVEALNTTLSKTIEAANKGGISLGELKAQIAQLQQAGTALTSIAALIDRFGDLEKTLGANATKVDAAKASLVAYRTQIDAMASAGAAEEKRLASLVNQLTAAEAAYGRTVATLQTVQQSLQNAGVDTNDLAAAQEKLKAVADQVGASLTKLNDAQLSYAANVRQTRQAAAELAAQQQQAAQAIAAQAAATAAQNKVAADAVAAQEAANAAGLKAAQQGVAQMQVQRDKADAEAESKERANTARLIGLQIQSNQQKATTQAAADVTAAAEAKAKADAEVKAYQDEQARLKAIIAASRTNGVLPPQSTVPGATGGQGGTTPTTPLLFLGLKPYELQNLSYQLNDIFTQIKSGTSISQTFSQQGGQILQLWVPNLFALRAYITPVIAGLLALAAAVGSVVKAFEEDSSLRQFTAQLAVNANGLSYQAAQLVAIREQVKQYGVGWSEAGALIKQAIQDGVSQDRIPQLIKLSQNIADVTGIKVPDAMKLLTGSLTHGMKGVTDLNDALGILTKGEFDHVVSLQNSNKAQEAGAYLIDTLSAKYGAAAKAGVSPFTTAVRDLKTAWDDLLITLANSSVIQGLVGVLTGLIKAVDGVVSSVTILKGTAATADAPPGYNLRKATSTLLGGGSPDQRDLDYDLKKLQQGNQVTNPATLTSFNDFFAKNMITNGVKLDSTSLQQLAIIFSSDEVKAALPAGAMMKLISGDRPNSTVHIDGVDTGRPSEHASKNAIDAVIVDANGNPVDMGVKGQMGAGAPNAAVDSAVLAAAKRLFPGAPVAVGGQFVSNYDPGHYSMNGPEAVSQATKRGDTVNVQAQQAVTNELEKQKIDAATLTRSDTERALQAGNYSKEIQDQLIQMKGQDAYQQALAQGAGETAAEAHKQAEIQQLTNDQYKTQAQYQQQDLVRRAQQKQFADQVAAAGKAGADQFLAQAKAQGISVSQGELRKAQLDAEDTALGKLQETERSTEELRAAQNQLAALQRQNGLKQLGDTAAAVKAVDLQYTAFNQQLDKIVQHNPGLASQVTQLRAAGEASKATAEGSAQLKAYIEDANAAAQIRNDLTASYTALLAQGAISQTEFDAKSKAAYDASNKSIADISAKFTNFIETTKGLDPTTVQVFTAKMKELGAQAEYVSPLMKAVKDAIGTGFTEGVVQGFNGISQAIGNVINKTGTWKDVLNSVPSAIATLFSTLFKDIAEAILKYEALQAVSALGLTGGSGAAGGILSFLGLAAGAATGSAADTSIAEGGPPLSVDGGGGGFFGNFFSSKQHEGGVVGRSGTPRLSNPSWFDGAPRYHDGTVVGLGPDEQAAVLLKGEEVLKKSDPRNIMNGGGMQVAPNNVKIVNTIDAGEFVSQGASTEAGEKAILNVIRSNASVVKSVVTRG